MTEPMHPGMAILWAYYPREPEPPDSTVALWNEALHEYEIRDVVEAARFLGRVSIFLPSLAEFVGVIVEYRNDRLTAEPKPELPEPEGVTLAEWLEHHATPEEREKAERFGVGQAVGGGAE